MSTVSDILGLLDKIPIWKRLNSLPAEVEALQKRVLQLEQITSQPLSKDRCPKCGERRFFVESSKPHPIMGEMGVVIRTYKCGACGYQEDMLPTT